MKTVGWKTILVASAFCLSAHAASAQPAMYVAGSGFADVKLFGGSGTPYYPSSEEPSLDATGAGGGLRIGTFLHPKISLEFAVDAGTKTRTTFRYPVYILAIFPSPPALQLKASTQFTTFSTVVGYHPAARGRVRFGYFAGLSFVKASYTSDLPGYVLPAVTFLEGLSSYQVIGSTIAPSTIPPSRLVGSTLPTSIYDPRPVTRHDLTAGTMLGFETAFELTNRLAVIPEVRAMMFAQPNDGPGVFLIRPGVAVRWGF